MAASTSLHSQTIAEKSSGSSGTESDTLQLLNGEEESLMPPLEGMSTSPERKTGIPLLQETKNTESLQHREKSDSKGNGLLQCEVCNALFETRRGLSSHARLHLRQLGVEMSDSSGGPIDLLYRLVREKALGGRISLASVGRPLTKKPHYKAVGSKKGANSGLHCNAVPSDGKPVPVPRSVTVKAAFSSQCSSPSATSPSRSTSPVLKRGPSSPLLRPPGHKPTTGRPTTPASHGSPKPLWAPQDTDAPLNLTLEMDPEKDIVCELCGAWFETRKGLSSHARAHLRHLGVVDNDDKCPPIAALRRIIHSEDFQQRLSSMDPEAAAELCLAPPSVPSSTPKRTLIKCPKPRGAEAPSSPVRPQVSKRPKLSPAPQGCRLSSGELPISPRNEPLKAVGCEFCGEYFENRKGLSSHARSHLRQMGVTEWSVNGSPIDTLMEEVARRGLPCALPASRGTKPPSSPPMSPPLSPPGPTTSPVPARHSPVATSRPPGRPPTARKACRPKPEPLEPVVGEAEGAGEYSTDPPVQGWAGPEVSQPPHKARQLELEQTREVRCEFCGEFFENRKGLSSHARSHLRQMGVTKWTVNGSPIDTLMEEVQRRGLPFQGRVKEEPTLVWEEPCSKSLQSFQKPILGISPAPFVVKGGGTPRLSQSGKRPSSGEGCSEDRAVSQSKTFMSTSQDSPFKDKTSPGKQGSSHAGPDASCELCGFCFENRKALASHARAHLRQFGVTEWRVNGSPIETLRAWMRSEPRRVAEMQRRSSTQGGWPQPKKKSGPFHSPSTTDRLYQKPLSPGAALGKRAGREVARGIAGSLRPSEGKGQGHGNRIPARRADALYPSHVAHSELNVRSPRGFERRPPKYPSPSEGGEHETGHSHTPRSNAAPTLVPKPPSSPLVKVVGDVYSLKCRFCELEFRGPLSVQEDWVRHLQRHILGLGLSKPAPPPPASAPQTPTSAAAVEAPTTFVPAASVDVPVAAQTL